MSLLGIDIGGTGCKVALFSEAGKLLAVSYLEYKVKVSGSYAELDSEKVWESCIACIQKISNEFSSDNVKAISVSAMVDTFTPVDKNGKALMDSIMSYDSRAINECQQLREKFDASTVYKKTGMPLHPMHLISKIMWLNNHIPQISEKVWKYLSYEDFILWKLGAEPCSSYSSAGRTMLFNNQTKSWDKDLMNICNIQEEKLPKVFPSGRVVGTVSNEIAKITGLSTDTKLVTGGFDQACCAIACGVFEKGSVVDTTGTNEILFFVADKEDQKALYENNFSYSYHVQNDRYSSFGHIFNAGGALKWFRDVFYFEGKVSYDFLDTNMPDEPTNLYFMPFLSGMGTPEMACDKRATIFGLSLDTEKNQISKAILEGITYELNHNLELIRKITKTNLKKIKAVGGAAKSNRWMQLKADITGITFETQDEFEPGAAGAAILAGLGCGIFEDFEQGYNSFDSFSVKKQYCPDPTRHEKYIKKYAKYCELREYSKIIEL